MTGQGADGTRDDQAAGPRLKYGEICPGEHEKA